MTDLYFRLLNRIERHEAQMAADPMRPCPRCGVRPKYLPAKVRTELAHREDCGHIANLQALAAIQNGTPT